ncbi:uncharacterized protein LOC124702324 [Lolium rigidum]|uniref:uncharacterized protein LOC124702324 n=1 Tax=Lolium rigidum TaxID=89674 RepID=UPI001F5C649F|nr:uncharacterized protein LOC124702324 [Lolium rigidum]
MDAEFVLRSGVRSGLKREFAFAIASQAALAPSRGRTRSTTTTTTSTSTSAFLSPAPAKEPKSRPSKRPRPHPRDPGAISPDPLEQPPAALPPDPPLLEKPPADETPVLALFASPHGKTEPPQQQLQDTEDFFIPPETPPRRVTRSMLATKSLPPAPSTRSKLEPHQPQTGAAGAGPASAPRRFTRSLLVKHNPPADDQDESGTTTASSGGSPSHSHNLCGGKSAEPKASSSKAGGLEGIPKNLKELLATGLLDGQRVKYIMRKGKGAVLRGVIKHSGILCSCALCKGQNVVTPYYFEVHAGSLKKRPSDYIFLERGNNNLYSILKACAGATLDTLESVIRAAIGSTSQKRTVRCKACKSPLTTPHTGKFASLCDPCLKSKRAWNSTRSPKVGRTLKSARVPKSFSPGANTITSPGRITKKDHGFNKLVFMSGVLPEGTDVGYYIGGKRLLDGYIKELGIYCHCCNSVVSPSQFEGHAGRASRRKPYHNIYMSNGVSLHELAISLSKGRKTSDRQSDDLCSICSDGGELLLCDTCPRAFHRECVGLSSVPRGTWCCRYCEAREQREGAFAYNNNARAAGKIDGVDSIEQIFTRSIRIATTPQTAFGGCALCKLHEFGKKKFSARTVLLCDQCGREYHVGCLKEHGMADLTALPKGAWYCSTDCVKIWEALKDLVSRGAEAVLAADADLIKKKREEKGLNEEGDLDVRWRVLRDKSSEDSKLVLSKAVAIFHESFDPIIQATTGRDLIPAMVYGRSVRDQDYTGMYCAVLTVGKTVVSAGLFRVMGIEAAELPLVATSRDNQGLGYFQALFSCIERLLASLGVKHFVLPAADEAVSIWTQRFGFAKITQDELLERLKGGRTTVFHGTSTLHKPVLGTVPEDG